MTTRSFAVLGYSGLVGSHLAKMLAGDPRYARGTLLGRRATGAL
jgi:aspartate-semialdehyde dehydrogenase